MSSLKSTLSLATQYIMAYYLDYDVSPQWYPSPEDPEWSDLTPIDLNESEKQFAYIPTDTNYTQIFAYLRALIAAQEFSPRGFKLTTVAVKLLNSNYTAWHYRRQCLRALSGDWARELAFSIRLADTAAKSYQIWQHRKMCVIELNNPCNELGFLLEHLSEDEPKNYHAWGYRQWLLRKFPCELTQWLIQTSYQFIHTIPQSNSTLTPFTEVNDELITILLENRYTSLHFLSQLTLSQLKQIPLYLLPIWQYEYEQCTILLGEDGDIRNNSVWSNMMSLLTFPYTIAQRQLPTALPQLVSTILSTEAAHTLYNKSLIFTLKKLLFYSLSTLTKVSMNESCYNFIFGLFNYIAPGILSTYLSILTNASNEPTLMAIEASLLSTHLTLMQQLLRDITALQCTTLQWAAQYQATLDNPRKNNPFLLSFLFEMVLVLYTTLYTPSTNLCDTILSAQNSTFTHVIDVNGLVALLKPQNADADENDESTNIDFKTDISAFFALFLSTLSEKTSQQQYHTQNQDTLTMLLDITIHLGKLLIKKDTVRQKYWLWRQIQVIELCKGGNYDSVKPTSVQPDEQWVYQR